MVPRADDGYLRRFYCRYCGSPCKDGGVCQAHARYVAVDIEAPDYLPACPKCGDLLPPGSVICHTCGASVVSHSRPVDDGDNWRSPSFQTDYRKP